MASFSCFGVKLKKAIPPFSLSFKIISTYFHIFASASKIKKIRGIKFPCYRLRIDFQSDSYRLFYGIDENIVYVLRIISKKSADKIINRIRNLDFPPE
jgi:mRNA-degrading endonuclease RelE of RelBE toxin-antitoxin system